MNKLHSNSGSPSNGGPIREGSNRESFLDRVAGSLGRPRRTDSVVRPDWKHTVHLDTLSDRTPEQLVEILKEQCFFIHTQVIESTPELLQQTLGDLIAGYGGGPVVRSGDPRFAEYGLSFPGDFAWSEHAGREENVRRAEAANIALVFADYALAESGTVVLASRPDQGRALHFLPAHYIAVIERERIVPRSTQAMADLNRRVEAGENLGSCLNMISGPSNSADIEMQLVVGVHGPLRATYVLV
ncbi:lactate utilization protein C [Saccharibacillus sp. CPCC 101409]|uniref:LutC/YkgG family protein n=1 Tax=Saccharibacillus sp. CPCC 101409 TaxID=3058041 RepID=UPI0026722D73|nr:lactate utilization protein C [Saccharibacillus sp. CPCC 101409]MDO3408801.1 lactate utilization protein C [Saccharibacillus sp. CPCC 101409]